MFNVLLVDDEKLTLITLQHAIPWKDYGFTFVESTTSPQDALELLKKKHFDACFVDIRMPHMNGLDLIEAVQQYDLDTLFVIVSGYSDFSYAKRALHYGVIDYCLKPVVTKDFIPVLEKLSSHIYSNRISSDSLYISKLLKDETFCSEFLSQLTTNNPECKELTLLQIHSKELLMVLKQFDKLLPEQVLFLDENNAILIWTSLADPNIFSSLIKESQQIALLIYDTTPPTTDSFQSSFIHLTMACQTEDATTSKVLKLYTPKTRTSVSFSNILYFIENNYDKPLTLKDLSNTFSINYSYLSQLFKKMIGQSFAEYLTDIRLKHACQLLSDTNIPISNISVSVGFNDYHYFCNTFKRYYFMTPSQYRNTYRKEINT